MSKSFRKYGPVVFPVQPVTPMPNLFEYQPNDFYDLRPGPSTPYNTTRTHSEWFDASPSLKRKLNKMTSLEEFPHKMNRDYYKFYMLPGMSYGPKWDKHVNVKLRTAKKHKTLYVPDSDVTAAYEATFMDDKELRRPDLGFKKRR